MKEREYRKLNISDLELVLEMNKNFRDGFIFKENARQFLLYSKNWIFACIEDKKIIGFAYGFEIDLIQWTDKDKFYDYLKD